MHTHHDNRGIRALARLALIAGLVTAAGCVAVDEQGLTLYGSPDLSDFDDAAGRAPTATTLYQLGKMLAANDRRLEAASVLTTCVDRYPDYLPAYVELADLYVREGAIDEAATTLGHGLDRAPDDPVLHNDLGMCWFLKDDYERAMVEFALASKAAPGDVRYRNNTALCIGMLGRYDDALQLYGSTLSLSDAHYNVGVLCEANGDHERAQTEFASSRATARRAPQLGGPPRATSR